MNIFDKLKLPFAKKVKQVPVSWVEEGPEHYYVIHHLLFGCLTDCLIYSFSRSGIMFGYLILIMVGGISCR